MSTIMPITAHLFGSIILVIDDVQVPGSPATPNYFWQSIERMVFYLFRPLGVEYGAYGRAA